MERGSLSCVLRNHDKALELDWTTKVNIVMSYIMTVSHELFTVTYQATTFC